MSEKKTYRLDENGIKTMIKQVLSENLGNEAFLGIDFGVKKRKQNRLNTFKYARLFSGLVKRIDNISKELQRRANILQGAQQQGQVNEGLIGAAVKGVGKYGLKNGLKGAAKVAGKKAFKRSMYLGLAGLAASLAGIPQNISHRLQQFKNPGQTTPKDVIEGYGELAEWTQELCQTTQQHPELLGAASLQDTTINGPGEVENGPFMTAGQGAGMAVSIGAACLGPVGLAAAAVFDVIDIASMAVRAGAEEDEEGLKLVQKQYEYMNTAAQDLEQALAQSSKQQQQPQKANIGAQKQMPQQQNTPRTQNTTQRHQLPNGYVIGKPAPFAGTDPGQVKKLQNFFGLQATGKWDRSTQTAWDNWLKQTYQTT